MSKLEKTYHGVKITIVSSRTSIVGYMTLVDPRTKEKKYFNHKIAGKDEKGELIVINENHERELLRGAQFSIDKFIYDTLPREKGGKYSVTGLANREAMPEAIHTPLADPQFSKKPVTERFTTNDERALFLRDTI